MTDVKYGNKNYRELPKKKPMSICQSILFAIGLTAIQYPERCGVCNRRIKGNRVTGYHNDCRCR